MMIRFILPILLIGLTLLPDGAMASEPDQQAQPKIRFIMEELIIEDYIEKYDEYEKSRAEQAVGTREIINVKAQIEDRIKKDREKSLMDGGSTKIAGIKVFENYGQPSSMEPELFTPLTPNYTTHDEEYSWTKATFRITRDLTWWGIPKVIGAMIPGGQMVKTIAKTGSGLLISAGVWYDGREKQRPTPNPRPQTGKISKAAASVPYYVLAAGEYAISFVVPSGEYVAVAGSVVAKWFKRDAKSLPDLVYLQLIGA
ncbi:MAG: hypothetical protein ACPGXY_03475 [Alphaproteobacteria bacterium]